VTTPPDPSIALVPVSETASALALPDIVRRAGQAAVLAAEEFFYGADSAERSLNVAIRCHGPVLAVTAFKFAQALKHSRPTRPVGRPPFAGGSVYLERMLRFGASPCLGYRVATKLVGGTPRFRI